LREERLERREVREKKGRLDGRKVRGTRIKREEKLVGQESRGEGDVKARRM